ncbi:Cuticle protein 16.8, partial [Stegodyphus mimosarum]
MATCFGFALFVTVLIALASSSPIPAQVSQLLSEQDVLEPPRPYEFGYEFGDGNGMTQHRRESANGNGLVQGSYGYTDQNGVYRNVEYKADSEGYRAIVRSNEPGLSNQNAADATFIVESPPPGIIAQ